MKAFSAKSRSNKNLAKTACKCIFLEYQTNCKKNYLTDFFLCIFLIGVLLPLGLRQLIAQSIALSWLQIILLVEQRP